MPAERFISKNYTLETLKKAIKKIYKTIYDYRTDKLIEEELEKYFLLAE